MYCHFLFLSVCSYFFPKNYSKKWLNIFCTVDIVFSLISCKNICRRNQSTNHSNDETNTAAPTEKGVFPDRAKAVNPEPVRTVMMRWVMTTSKAPMNWERICKLSFMRLSTFLINNCASFLRYQRKQSISKDILNICAKKWMSNSLSITFILEIKQLNAKRKERGHILHFCQN